MNTKIYKLLSAIVAVVMLTACSDDFLEVQNPTGEPLEEYYMTDEHLAEAGHGHDAGDDARHCKYQ